jgi:hypothetical protein
MRATAVQLTEKGQRLVSELARECRKTPAKVIEVALESYWRQQGRKRAGSTPRKRGGKKASRSDKAGWDKWRGYARKSFEEMGFKNVDEYIEAVRGR